jgi:hypothetical protein
MLLGSNPFLFDWNVESGESGCSVGQLSRRKCAPSTHPNAHRKNTHPFRRSVFLFFATCVDHGAIGLSRSYMVRHAALLCIVAHGSALVSSETGHSLGMGIDALCI